MTIYAVQTFEVATNGTRYELLADIPPGENRTALLFAHTTRAATNTAEYGLSAGDGWRPLGKATATTTNRRYVSAAFARAEPAAGPLRIQIDVEKPVTGLVAFLCLTDSEPGEAAVLFDDNDAGDSEPLSPDDRAIVAAVQARPGSRIEAADGMIVCRGQTQETDASTSVVAALVAAERADALSVWATTGQLLTALGVPLVVQPDEPPPPPVPELSSREISVIVRDIEPGGSHEVRHVRPGEIVMGPNGIDWEQTPYTAYILARDEDVQPTA